jgi:hypothetical protein
MPTVFLKNGYRFFFYSNDHEPVHIHIEKDGKTAKFYIDPIGLVKSRKFNSSELKEIRKLVTEEKNLINKKWYEFFNNK